MKNALAIGLVVAGVAAAALAWQLYKVSNDPAVRAALDAAGKAGAAADALGGAAGAAGGAVEKAGNALGELADGLRKLLPKPAPEDAPIMEG